MPAPETPVTPGPAPAASDAEMSVEQLAARVGMSVRTVRFYASRGLIPGPRREGRHGYYGADHVARLELVRELQTHGFTLSAIEGYLEQLPEGATPGEIALQRTMLAPWTPDLPEQMSRAELARRAGRALGDDDLELLVALGIVEPTPAEDVFCVAPTHLALGVHLLESGMPLQVAHAARRTFTEAGRRAAAEVSEIFRTQWWPQLRSSGASPEDISALVERFKPLTIHALVNAYASAIDATKREQVRRRTPEGR